MTIYSIVAFCILTAFAWIGMVHAVDLLVGHILKIKMEWEMLVLMEKHRKADREHFKLSVQDEIDHIIETM